MVQLTLTRLLFLALKFQIVLGLNASDGYNIGVVLGSIAGALAAVAIGVFIFYFFCVRRWLGIGEPAELGYSRQNDYNLKKQQRPSSTSRYGIQGKAPPYGGGGGGGVGRRQGATNDVYQPEDHRSHQGYPSGDSGGAPAVVLTSGGSDQQLRQHSPNISYSSEEVRAGGGRSGFEVTTTRAYQQRSYTAGGGGGGGSPISAAYLGTGV